MPGMINLSFSTLSTLVDFSFIPQFFHSVHSLRKLFSAMSCSFTLWILVLIFGQSLKVTAMQVYGTTLCTEFSSILPNLQILTAWSYWPLNYNLDLHSWIGQSCFLFELHYLVVLESRSNFAYFILSYITVLFFQDFKTVTAYIYIFCTFEVILMGGKDTCLEVFILSLLLSS